MSQHRQTIKNLISNVISLAINIILGLFYTPYLVKSLGIVAYGIVPLALIINQYVNVITGSLTGSLTRFYTVAFQQKNYKDASKYLSSSFFSISALVTLLTPIFGIIIIRIDTIFNIPAEHLREAQLLFLFTISSFILSMYASLYNITLYSQNRLDLLNVVKIIRISSKVLFTILFFESIRKGISFIGFANFVSELLVLLISIFYYKQTITREVRISLKSIEKMAISSILAMTVWVLVHQIGDTGLYKIDTVLVNLFWSTRESGILGALSEFGTYVMTIVAVIASLFGPLILIAYSNNDHKAVVKLASDNSLAVGLCSSLIVGLVVGFAEPIISLWLGKEYVEYKYWFILKQITLPFYAAAGVFSFVFRAWNRVIFPALATLLLGLMNFAVSYFFCTYSNGSEDFILFMLIASFIFITIQSYGLNSFYFFRLYPEIGIKTPLIIFAKILFGLIVTIFLARVYLRIVQFDNIFNLILGFSIVTILSLLVGFVILLNSRQRIILTSYVSKGRLYIHNWYNGYLNNNCGL